MFRAIDVASATVHKGLTRIPRKRMRRIKWNKKVKSYGNCYKIFTKLKGVSDN